MALRRAITKRLINQTTPFNHNSIHKPLNVTKSYFHHEPLNSPHNLSPPNDHTGFFRRFLQRRKINQSSMSFPELFSFPVGEKLREKLNETNGDRLRFDGLQNPVKSVGISVNDAKKILKVSQLNKVRAAVKMIPANSISYMEFVTICIDTCCNHEQGLEFSKMLDEAGDVIVLGNVVFLRPDQLAKSMEELLSQSIAAPNDPRKRQLEELETQKALIDQKSLSQVRSELYGGLGFLIIQTIGFMRLTFWELSWDVMEPICFFVTSFHFALAYMFFIKTSKEPTFEGYFQRRFKTKQRKLMEVHNFNLRKYSELCKVFYPTHRDTVSTSSCFDDLSRGGRSNTMFS
ncbi:calcium uniporter protein 4, mitochondrial-like [Rutidosis leptorrhynchoides]|uniref:calcium uniporter protein 4, mitochondrial-like n=1 Tax=Rutidosis leptorrhynchoides TaxID=125765 RepID=UPI003A99A2E6